MRIYHEILAVAAGAATVVLLAGSPVSGEPLRDLTKPSCSSVDADYAGAPPKMSPNCKAPSADDRHDTLEVSLKAARGPAQIGDFLVTDAYLYNDSYTPEVWSVDRGDKIAVAFDNSLSGTAGFLTNLHSHGLIVSPRNAPGAPTEKLGDNVYALIYSPGVKPADHSMHGAANAVPMRNFEKTASYLIDIPKDHPEGLFWYHPHPHGISGPQIAGGMAGFLTVGRPSDYITHEMKEGEIDTKLLMLKDTQITRQPGAKEWRINDKYDAGNCGDSAKKEPGVCFKDDTNAWIFPVNGQIYPTIEVKEGVGQLWRIGNLGANATYQLELVEIADDGKETLLPFQIIANDGVAIGRTAGQKPLMQEKLLVMPSARLEVLVRHPGAAGKAKRAVFRTIGFDTGAKPGDGDTWPAVDLAEVVFADTLPDSDKDSGFALVTDGSAAVDFKTQNATSGDAECPRLAKDEFRMVAFDIPSVPAADRARPGFTQPRGCTVDQTFQIIGSVVTRIKDDSSFKGVLSAFDQAVGDKYSRPFPETPQAYRGKCFDGALDTCVPYPSVEDWWVVNASSEAHNFHIHQTRFEVLEVRGASSDFTPIPNVLEDNYPVLAGQAIKVRIAFNREEQIGTFVYHCHILQHEDKGMMAAIEVRKIEAK